MYAISQLNEGYNVTVTPFSYFSQQIVLQGSATYAEIKVTSVENLEKSKVISFSPGMGYNMALPFSEYSLASLACC